MCMLIGNDGWQQNYADASQAQVGACTPDRIRRSQTSPKDPILCLPALIVETVKTQGRAPF